MMTSSRVSQTKDSGDSRLQYLNNISQRLSVTSPVVSAHLQTTRYALAEDLGVKLDGGGRICKACGSSLILGWSCKRVKKADQRKRKSAHFVKDAGTADLEVQCETCNAITTRPTARPKSTAPRSTINPQVPSKMLHELQTVQKTTEVPTNSVDSAKTNPPRKRSRNSKNSSLQAMLKSSQNAIETSKSGGFGLGFEDLMVP